MISETDPLGQTTSYTYRSFAATKDLCITMLSDLIHSLPGRSNTMNAFVAKHREKIRQSSNASTG